MVRHRTRTRVAQLVLGLLLFTQGALAMAGCDWSRAAPALTVAASSSQPPCHEVPAINANLCLAHCLSADQSADTILREIRRQGALSIACHPHHTTTRRIEISTCYLWDHREELSDLVDVWEAANRDDLFSVTSLKHYPYVANSDFHKPKHLYSWKTLVRSEKNWPAIRQALRSNVDIAITLFRNGSWSPAA